MRKSKTQSTFYYRQPEVMSPEDRLDFMYWHPKFDYLIELFASNKFKSKELSALVRTPIVSGKTPNNYIYPTKGVLFIGARNVRYGKIDLTDSTYVDDFIHEGMLKSSKLSKGDILTTMAGFIIGRTAMYDRVVEANISQSVARIRPDLTQVNPYYLMHYLNSPLGQAEFDRNKHDVGQPNINTTEIGKIKVLLPLNRKDQDEIADKLYKMENDISTHTAKLQEASRGINTISSVELGLSLPVTKHDYFNKPPETQDERLDFVWNRPITETIKKYLLSKGAVPLGTIIENEIAYGINAYGKEKGKIPFVNVENLDLDGMIQSSQIRYLDDSAEEKILKENDILVSRSRTVGIAGLITKKEAGFTFGSYILRLRARSDSNIDPMYIVNFINSEFGQAQITYLQTGSREVTQGGGNNINPDQLRQMLIVLPSSPEQQFAIVTKVKQLLEQKNKEQAKLAEMTFLFKRYFEPIFSTGKLAIL